MNLDVRSVVESGDHRDACGCARAAPLRARVAARKKTRINETMVGDVTVRRPRRLRELCLRPGAYIELLLLCGVRLLLLGGGVRKRPDHSDSQARVVCATSHCSRWFWRASHTYLELHASNSMLVSVARGEPRPTCPAHTVLLTRPSVVAPISVRPTRYLRAAQIFQTGLAGSNLMQRPSPSTRPQMA